MRFRLLFFIYFLCVFLLAFDSKLQGYEFVLIQEYIEDPKLSKNFIDLLNVLEMYPSSVEKAVNLTQKEWIRKKERWNLKETHHDKRDQILDCMDKLGFLRKKDPIHKQYDQAVLLGASLFSFRNRIHFLVRKWQEGVRFNAIILLGSDRPLDPEYEKPFLEQLDHLPRTEMEMMQYLFETADIPEKMRHVKLLKLNAPMFKTEKGYRRATTLDTISLWLKEYPPKESCLLISNQPFVDYQDAVAHMVLPKSIVAETVGDSASLSLPSDVFLDMVARLFFIETTLQKKLNLAEIESSNAESIN